MQDDPQEELVAETSPRRDPDLGVAYAGIAVGALAVVGATAVGLRWAARPPVRRLVVGPGWITWQGPVRRR